MFTVFDSATQELIEVFEDYEDAQMFVLHASDLIPDGGANLSIEPISTAQEWALNNGIELGVLA